MTEEHVHVKLTCAKCAKTWDEHIHPEEYVELQRNFPVLADFVCANCESKEHPDGYTFSTKIPAPGILKYRQTGFSVDDVDGLALEYVCDGMRHLVCLPYSVENLHAMASDLGLKRHWFHRGASYPHYDIPVKRRAAIEERCRKVPAKVLLAIVKGIVVTVEDLDAVEALADGMTPKENAR